MLRARRPLPAASRLFALEGEQGDAAAEGRRIKRGEPYGLSH